MKGTLEIRELLLGEFQSMRFTQQPLSQFVWQRRAVVAGQFAASEPLGECTVVDTRLLMTVSDGMSGRSAALVRNSVTSYWADFLKYKA